MAPAMKRRGNRVPSHQARRSLGQNFLVDQNLQRKIVDALDPAPHDEVVEIGPGKGALTRHLAGKVGRLVLVELDEDLAGRLAREYAGEPSVTVFRRDILQLQLDQLSHDPARLKVIGNIPYNITTPIIFHLLDSRPRPHRILIMVQREVADRVLATPGGKTYGALAVGVQAVAEVERVLQVGRNAFRPVPDVDSTLVRITPHAPPQLDPLSEVALRSLTRIAFGYRRKQFQRILRDVLGLSTTEVEHLESVTHFDLERRPETFAPQDLTLLARRLSDLGRL